jgi:hypothetical protein
MVRLWLRHPAYVVILLLDSFVSLWWLNRGSNLHCYLFCILLCSANDIFHCSLLWLFQSDYVWLFWCGHFYLVGDYPINPRGFFQIFWSRRIYYILGLLTLSYFRLINIHANWCCLLGFLHHWFGDSWCHIRWRDFIQVDEFWILRWFLFTFLWLMRCYEMDLR